MVNIGNLIGKARQAVRDNPDKFRDGLGKVTGAIDKRTGGKYRDQLAKGSDMLGNALGVPSRRGPQVPERDIPVVPTAPGPSGRGPIPPSTPPAGPTTSSTPPVTGDAPAAPPATGSVDDSRPPA